MAGMAPLCLGQIAVIRERKEAKRLISLQVHVLRMNLTTFFFPKGKASIREVRKDPAAFKMMMTLTGGSTRANTLFNICLQSSDKF